MPHRGDELADTDVAARAVRGILSLVDPGLHGLDGFLEREATGQVLLGRPAHLAVDHAIGGEVFDELARDPAQPVSGLHDRGRQIEGLEVLHERPGVALHREPGREAVRVGVGHIEADLATEFDDGRGAHTAVEVVVQRHLRQAPDRDSLDNGIAVLVDGHVGLLSGGVG